METLKLLEGKKTYIIAGLTILWGIIGLALQRLDSNQAIQTILAGLAMIGFRSAIAKLE